MSAAQHREVARRDQQAAAEQERSYDPISRQPPAEAPSGYTFSASIYNPGDPYLREAERLRAHAAQHEQAAKALEHFEKAECRDFPPSVRAACPLFGPLVRIDDLPNGVRATFAPGTRVDAVVAHMRCHYAYAQARAFAEDTVCPLYLRGIEITRARDPLAIEIVSVDAKVADAIRARSREEAVFLRQRAPE
jgi:hypothetical protein